MTGKRIVVGLLSILSFIIVAELVFFLVIILPKNKEIASTLTPSLVTEQNNTKPAISIYTPQPTYRAVPEETIFYLTTFKFLDNRMVKSADLTMTIEGKVTTNEDENISDLSMPKIEGASKALETRKIIVTGPEDISYTYHFIQYDPSEDTQNKLQVIDKDKQTISLSDLQLNDTIRITFNLDITRKNIAFSDIVKNITIEKI